MGLQHGLDQARPRESGASNSPASTTLRNDAQESVAYHSLKYRVAVENTIHMNIEIHATLMSVCRGIKVLRSRKVQERKLRSKGQTAQAGAVG